MNAKNTSRYLGISGTFLSALLFQQVTSASPALAHNHRGGDDDRGRLRGATAGGDILRGNRQRDNRADSFASHFALQNNAIQLDLSSAERSITLTQNLVKHGNSVTISVGGAETTFNVGDQLTAGELVAVKQEQSGRQSIQLDGNGRAQGGTFSLNSIASGKSAIDVSDIVIPQSVQAMDMVSGRNRVEISGDLTNYGSIYQIARGKQGASSFSADNIVNETSGLITSISRGGGSVDLSFNASRDFENKGTISSSGSLDINAGGMFKNAGGPPRGSLYADRDVTIRTSNANNLGDITSGSGSVTFASGAGQDLIVNNVGGVISATSGDINIHDAAYNETGYASITGGDLLSQHLNLNSGQGVIDVKVDQLTGEVVSTGSAVHVSADTDNLTIGKQCLAGDPTFYNSGGSITINGNITVGEALAIIARDSITATGALTSIDTHNGGANQGFDISIIAGVNVTGAGGDTTTTVPGTQAVGNVSFTGASVNGGDVNLTGSGAGLTIDSRSLLGNFAGGNITLAAYQGAGGGNVILNNDSTINATGSGTGANGNVTIVTPNSISLGSITGAANFSLVTSQPVFSSGGTMTFNTTGNITTGNTIQGNVGALGIGTVTIPGSVNAGAMTISAGSNAQISTVALTQNLSVTAKNNINFSGNITAPQGILMVAGHNVTATGSNTLLLTEGATQISNKAGDVTIVAGAAFTETANQVTIITGPGTGDGSATGGQLSLTNVQQLRANATVANSGGGDVNLVAFVGSDNTGGTDWVNRTLRVQANSVSRASGDITVVAGGSTAQSINWVSMLVNTTGGTAGTGNIFLNAATPNVAAGNIVINKTGTIQSGQFENGSLATGGIDWSGSNITFGNTNTTIKLIGGGSVSAGASWNALTSDLILKGDSVTLSGATTLRSIDVEAVSLFTTFNNVSVTNAISATASNGNIQIGQSPSQSFSAPLGITLVASGNITTGGASETFSTRNTSGDSGDMTIVAGAAFTNLAGTVTVTGASATGGDIDFNTNPATAIQTDSTFTNGAGGNLVMAAFSDGGGNLGSIATANATITSGGNGIGINGNVTLAAGNNTGDAIGTAVSGVNINSTGGAFGTGDVFLSASTPNTTLPVVIDKNTGAILSGDFLNGTRRNGAINIASITNTGTVFVTKAGQFDLFGPLSAGNLVVEADLIRVQATVNTTRSVALLSSGDIRLDGDLRAAGGLVLVAGNDIFTQAAGVDLVTTSGIADSGNMVIVAGAAFSRVTGFVSITGASVTGGRINFAATPIGTIATNNATSGFNAGDLVMVAFTGTDGTGDIVANGSPNGILSGGGGLGTLNGDVNVVAGKTTAGTAINLPNINGGPSGDFGTITLTGATPTVSGGSPLVVALLNGAGNIITGNPVNGSGAVQTTDIVAQDITQRRADVNITSGRNVLIGDIDVSGQTGNGGDVVVRTLGTQALLLGQSNINSIDSIDTSAPVSGNPGSVSLTNLGGFGIGWVLPAALDQSSTNGAGAHLTLDAGTGNLSLPTNSLDYTGTGQGGQVDFTARDILWTNSVTLPLTIDVSGTIGQSAGSIFLNLNSGNIVNIGNTGGRYLLKADGGTGVIEVHAPTSDIIVDSAGISLTAATNTTGGALTLEGSTITGAAGNLLVLDASGNGNGDGGRIELDTTDNTAALVIGTLPGGIQLIAQSGDGTGDGGVVVVQAAGDLTVDPAAISVNPLVDGDGGGVVLRAGANGNGNLRVNAPITVNGIGTGDGGGLVLDSNSATAFAIGSKKSLNGITGTITLSGATNGNLLVVNHAGGITQSSAVLVVDNVIYDAGGAVGGITISKALGTSDTTAVLLTSLGTGSVTASKTVTADSVIVNTGGTVGGKKALPLNASNVSLNANGQVNASDSRTTGVALSVASSATSNFMFTAAGNISANNASAAGALLLASTAQNGSIVLNGNVTGGNVTIAATGNGTVTQTSPLTQILGTDLILQSRNGSLGTVGTPLRFNVANVSLLSSGDAIINDTAPGDLNVVAASTAGDFTLTSAGPVNLNASLKSAANIRVTTATDMNIVFNASQGGKSTQSISFNAGGGGDIGQGNPKATLTALNSINMFSTSGDINALSVSAPNLSLQTFAIGVVNVISTSKSDVNLNDSSSGNLFSLTTAGGMTVHNVFGNTVNLTANSGTINFAGGTVTADIGIVINNTSAKSGIIEFGTGTTMTTTGSTGTPGVGEIQIVVGALPPGQVVGTTPANVNATGSVFFNNGLTASAPTNNVSGINTNLIFSAPTAGQILLDGNVTITADPPFLISAPEAANPDFDSSLSSVSSSRAASLASALRFVTAPTDAIVSKLPTPNLIPGAETTIVSSATTQLDQLGESVFNSLLVNSEQTADCGFTLSSISLKPTANACFLPSTNDRATGWISETELEGGHIPATLVLENSTTDGASLTEGTVPGTDSARYLNSGALLCANAGDTTIETPFGKVSVAAKSVALVMAFRDGIAIFDLHDGKHGAVAFSDGSRKVSLRPGQAVTIARQSVRSFEEINPAQLIGYRHINEQGFNDELKLYTAEFSLPSAIHAVPSLKALMQSKHPHAAHMAKNLLKTTSVLLHLQSSGVGFQQKLRPQVTAQLIP